jgi:hypothetical protein
MALAYTKAGWNFAKYLYAYEQNVETMNRHWYFGLKTVLVALGWEVRGGLSSVGLFHNTNEAYGAYSGSDPWPTFNDANKTGGDMYIIMRHPSGFEICFGSNYSSQTNYLYFHFFIASHNAAFGAANSGANGTSGTSAVPPTASDQQVVYNHNVNVSNTGINSGGTFSIYGARSNDNLSSRLMIQRVRGQHYWFALDHLDNAHANLDNGGRVFTMRTATSGEPTGSVMDNDFYTSALYYGRVSGVNRALYAGAPGYANLGHQSLNIVQADNKMVVAPMDIYNNTLGEKGYYGTIPDCYWGNNGHYMALLGDSVGGAPNWFSGGSIISPWDGVTPEPLPRIN